MQQLSWEKRNSLLSIIELAARQPIHYAYQREFKSFQYLVDTKERVVWLFN